MYCHVWSFFFPLDLDLLSIDAPFMASAAPKQQNESFDGDFLQTVLGNDEDIHRYLKNLAESTAQYERHFKPAARVEQRAQEFYSLMQGNEFWPSPAILLHENAPQPRLFTATSLLVSDVIDEIYSCLQKSSLLLQNEIQVGLDFSGLRGSRHQGGVSAWQNLGPVRYMELFERAPQVSQNRTPLRFMLNIDHQDIHDFLDYATRAPVHIKLAIALTDGFIHALTTGGRIGLKHRPDGEITREAPAAELFRGIAKLLQRDVPVDLVFVDALEKFRDAKNISASCILSPHNQLMEPGELAATGCLNLAAFINGNSLDEVRLERSIGLALRFLDNCFERNFYPDSDIENITRTSRRVIISLLGIESVLGAIDPSHHPENRSRLSLQLAMRLQMMAIKASQLLARERGACHNSMRNVQVLGQLSIPLIPQIANEPGYFLRREMTLDDFKLMYPLHAIWQGEMTNIVSLKHPIKGMDLATLTSLVLETHKLGLPVFEMIG